MRCGLTAVVAGIVVSLGSAASSQEVRGVWCRTPVPNLPDFDSVIVVEEDGDTLWMKSRFGDGSELPREALIPVSDQLWQMNAHGEMVRISEDWIRMEFLSANGDVFSVLRRLGLSPEIDVARCRLEGGSEEF
jgi:hypothetical protein